MIYLKLSEEQPKQKELLDIILSMSLAHKLELKDPTEDPLMIAFGKTYKGIDSIKEGITEIESVHEQWYACRCDMFEDK